MIYKGENCVIVPSKLYIEADKACEKITVSIAVPHGINGHGLVKEELVLPPEAKSCVNRQNARKLCQRLLHRFAVVIGHAIRIGECIDIDTLRKIYTEEAQKTQ